MATESTESSRIEKEIAQTSDIALGELRDDAREAALYGYDYVSIQKIEKAMIALALLSGATSVPSLEAALDFLQTQAGDIIGLETANDEFERENEDLQQKLRSAEERIEVLEKVLGAHGLMKKGILLAGPQLDDTRATLEASYDVLSRVPGQRKLAQHTLRVVAQLDDGLTEYFVPVNEADTQRAFPEGN